MGKSDNSLKQILEFIVKNPSTNRLELARKLNLSRSTLTQRLSQLFKANIIQESEDLIYTGGRPARGLTFNSKIALVLVADIGETHIRFAATDMQSEILMSETDLIDFSLGPKENLDWISTRFLSILNKLGKQISDVIGIGLSLPSPVNFIESRTVNPSIMTGWEGFDIRKFLEDKFHCLIAVDSDVHLLTLIEHRRFWKDVNHMIYIKVGTGIGCGIIVDNKLYRGAQGASGDIGHIHLGGFGDPLCRCGNLGCVEAIASGWAIARDLSATGLKAKDGRDVMKYVQNQVPEAVHSLRTAGRVVGEVIANSINILNPNVLVIGGTLSRFGDHLEAGIKEVIFQRSLPLATKHLVIAKSQLDEKAGILGASQLVIDECFQTPYFQNSLRIWGVGNILDN